MWFKQLQVFHLPKASQYTAEFLTENLEFLIFKPCAPSMPSSMGWVSPLAEEGGPLVRTVNGCSLFCLQVEEKILPATVIKTELDAQIKQIEALEDRKVKQKERYRLKDELMLTLLPRAFSKFTKIYAYIDSKNNWLVLGTTQASKVEQFLAMFKKSVTEEIKKLEWQNIALLLTQWLKDKNYPTTITIDKKGVLQDPKQQNRIIRCQQQDLFASSIQALLKEGCEVVQLGLCWQDRLSFMLSAEFFLRGISYQDELKEELAELEPVTQQQRIDADFLLMATSLSPMLAELVVLFAKKPNVPAVKSNSDLVTA